MTPSAGGRHAAPFLAITPAAGRSPTDDDFQRMKAEIDSLNTVSGRVDQEKAVEALDRKKGRSQDNTASVFEVDPVDYELIIDLGRKNPSAKIKKPAGGELSHGRIRIREGY